MKKEECKSHSWHPVGIDEIQGFVFYVCEKCTLVVWKELEIIERIGNVDTDYKNEV